MIIQITVMFRKENCGLIEFHFHNFSKLNKVLLKDSLYACGTHAAPGDMITSFPYVVAVIQRYLC